MLRPFLFSLTITIFSTSLLWGADWTAFRGPDGNGKSPDSGLLKKWDDAGPPLLWSIDTIGFGYSSPVISGDRIYISGNVERSGKKLSMIFCLDKSGKLIWEKDNGPAQSDTRK
ncbi:MAG: PQQ-binding-like beta-propeller repeat protein [Planctomycetaceae bacterium]|jgi:outer membrane protein assembly factor BamB|nr:PQQ-binding-like beta-propeller repeat protein [Planctomycetaceae bacterium]